MVLERMDAFFAARAHMYDEHMLSNVEGCKNGYIELTKRLPSGTKSLLDLGCGTGLELHEIFARFPDLEVTGIDITPEMLEQLRRKFADKHITLINASYFDCDLGVAVFDAAVSFQTMHTRATSIATSASRFSTPPCHSKQCTTFRTRRKSRYTQKSVKR